MAYNPLYERLVDASDREISGFVAYGIYKRVKREWIRGFEDANGRAPNAAELDAYVSTWTPELIRTVRDAAESGLAEYAASAINDAKPGIVEEALKGTALRSILLSVMAALIYTVLLLGLALSAKAMGVDLISALQTIGPPH